MKIKAILLAFCCWIILPSAALAQATLKHINVIKSQKTISIQLLLTQSTAYEVFMLSHPDRLVIDLKQAELGVYIPNKTLKNPIVRKVRGGNPDLTRLRLVFELGKKVRYKTSVQPKKIIIDLESDPDSPQSITKLIPPVKKPVEVVAKPISLVEKFAPFLVVIDAGHGGKDSGAVGKHGTQEKQVVLAIAQRLAKLINSQPNMKAVLTRNGDYFVPLRGRLQVAYRDKADVFVAIHADSFFNMQAKGASVYALSKRGATSEAARWLAKQENYSELGGVNLK